MAEKFANKIARQVHASPTTDEFDLAGYSKTQCEQLGEELFAHTFRVPSQFRISFIIGGGREVRQKYDANLPKWLADVLRSHGFEDDNGARITNDCQKKYKYQEDTGKNVKRLHVFPSSEILEDNSSGTPGQLSNEDKIIRSTPESLPGILNEHVPTWLQRRRAQHVLSEFSEKVDTIEQKMIKCQPLTEEEAELYHAEYADKEVVKKKINIVTKLMKHLVAAGELNPDEKEHLLAQSSEKLTAMEVKLGLAASEGDGGEEAADDANIPEVARKAMDKVKSRIEKLTNISPRTIPLRRAAEIKKLWKAMKPLQNHEISGPNKRKALDQLPVMEAQVKELINESRDWFETDEELQTRVAELRATIKAQGKSKGGGGKSKSRKAMSKKQQLKAARGLR